MAIRKKPKNIFFILFFDAVFIIILTALGKVMKSHLPQSADEISRLFAGGSVSPLALAAVFLLYMLFVIFLHSMLKLPILGVIASYDGMKVNLKLGKFFLLNIIIFLISGVILTIISMILAYMFKPELLGSVMLAVLVIYAVFFYIFINFSHSLFIEGGKIRDILRKGFSIASKGIKKYYGALLWVLVPIVVCLVFFLIFGNIAKLAKMPQLTYDSISSTIASALFYAVIFINRVYFYLISKNVRQ